MAWKLRKEKADEETGVTAPAVTGQDEPFGAPEAPAQGQPESDQEPFSPFEFSHEPFAPAETSEAIQIDPAFGMYSDPYAKPRTDQEHTAAVAEPFFDPSEPFAVSAPQEPTDVLDFDRASGHRTLEIDPEQEAFVPRLGDAEPELPRVSPFIVDVPAAAQAPASPIIGNLVMRIGTLSATFAIKKDVITIGRPDSVLQYYPDIEIEIDDAVSRRHAEVRRKGENYFVADTGSTNGTLLNGELLTAHQEYPLIHGDRIRVGEKTEIVFE